ncbi:TetR/AcrR family transcriptional regulator [Streptacidiphilus sp. P02-A3a]|uniref:TetR/AcrR family transcriptional regulator n=1 Tax=Streptacidiphilus sp. P02-A3a TaxID=2704468 RepID=UPI0015F826CD|nr:TetR/AcrR family transcriptional regulator [Streptacidiphilus sp. P02-A3a]QMU71599.1 TetR/AcrR family transcriptional regulator [Streptacidiphilus sp. P02-A3a]
MATPSAAPRRADARRNRTQVLIAAEELLAARGMPVSFDDVARHAGVGVGTVYRHFPTRSDLFRAVVASGMLRLIEEARDLARAVEPGPAFLRFLSLMTEQAALNKALCQAFEASAELQVGPETQREFLSALGELLARAQTAGTVRDDIDAADVCAFAVGTATMDRVRADSARPQRMAALANEALLRVPPAAAAPTTAPVVTKQAPAPAIHNETLTHSAARDETPRTGAVPALHCEQCGSPVHPLRTGRRPRFCGAACRQRAHRLRHAAVSG